MAAAAGETLQGLERGLAVIQSFSHDAPALGGSGTYTGYAVQTAGNQVGYPN